jgi:hypothetical protein
MIIFLGDIQEYLSVVAKDYNQSAWLLDHSNYKSILDSETNLESLVVYTSLGDLPKDLGIVYKVLCQASTIFYCPPVVWSDNKTFDIADPGSSMAGLTEILLGLLPDSVQVKKSNSLYHDPMPVVDSRKTDSKQIWTVGCSISHGVGVEPNERYGALISKELNLPCSFLTRAGSAIDWAADQILRADINTGDLVVWGITNPDRLTYIHNDQLLVGVTMCSYDAHSEYKKIFKQSELFSQQTIYRHFYAIQQIINYCKKLNVKLILVGVLGGYSFLPYLKSYKNYIQAPYQLIFEENFIRSKFLDVGSDSWHPGVKQHEQYKNIILENIKTTYQGIV